MNARATAFRNAFGVLVENPGMNPQANFCASQAPGGGAFVL